MSYIDLMKTIYIRILILILLSGNTYSQKFTELNQKIFFRSNAYTTAWADFDNDNDFDLAVAFDNGNVSLYQNNDGNFTNIRIIDCFWRSQGFYGAADASVWLGFLNCFLWICNLWCIFKETSWHSTPNFSHPTPIPNHI